MRNHQAELSLVGLGPGDFAQLTHAAQQALQQADVVIGYQVYIDMVRPLLDEARQDVVISPIGNEMERAEQAVTTAAEGQHVAMISSGDIGIYAMASPIFEVLRANDWDGSVPEVTVYPGVSAIQATAARLGAPLGHDFCTISLSDLLTPWSVIERRLQAAAWGDFVIAFYNPRSQKRDWQLPAALDILRAYRPATTPVAIARNVTRPDEQISITTLADLDPTQVDMFTLVLIGNSQSYTLADRIVTPRGYVNEGSPPSPPKVESQSNSPRQEARGEETVYPVTLIHPKTLHAVVVGGGPVGERKVRGLLAAGIVVTLITPEATENLQAWGNEGQINWTRRPYQTGDLAEATLVFAATNQRAINAQIATEAKQRGVFCNVADVPSDGTFHVPAVHRQESLVISVSTSGNSPVRAKQIRDEVAGWLETN